MLAHARRDVQVEGNAADAHHIPTLLTEVRGIKQVIGNLFQQGPNRRALHHAAIGRRIGDGRLRPDILCGDIGIGQQRGAPAKAWRKRDLGIVLLQQRIADNIIPGASSITAPP